MIDKVNGMSNIGTHDGQILKSTDKRSVKSGIRKQGTIRRQVLRNNHRGVNRLAVK